MKTYEILIEILFRIFLLLIGFWLSNQFPVIRHIDEEELWQYRYPLINSYFPKFIFYISMFALPCLAFIIEYIFNYQKDDALYDIINTAMGLSLTYCIVGLFTECLKIMVGRPRPNFFYRCFPGGVGTNIEECSGDYESVMEARKSFPSGHTSLMFSCAVYLFFHYSQKLNINQPRFMRGLVITSLWLLPLIAAMTGASRTADYNHHFSDVVGGAILGAVVAFMVYHNYNQYDVKDYQEVITKLKKEM